MIIRKLTPEEIQEIFGINISNSSSPPSLSYMGSMKPIHSQWLSIINEFTKNLFLTIKRFFQTNKFEQMFRFIDY